MGFVSAVFFFMFICSYRYSKTRAIPLLSVALVPGRDHPFFLHLELRAFSKISPAIRFPPANRSWPAIRRHQLLEWASTR